MSIVVGAHVRIRESEINRLGDLSPKLLTRVAVANEQTAPEFKIQARHFSNIIKPPLRKASKLLFSIFMVLPFQASAAQFSHADFIKLAAQCAPNLSSSTLEAVARTESNLDPWNLHDDTTGETYEPDNLSYATLIADRWIARGDSVDIGLMQINSQNFKALELTPRTALDPCVSLASGAAVLRAAYVGGDTQADQQVALLIALSRYNTGTPFEGIMNGYARNVMMNVRNGEEVPQVPLSPARPPLFVDPNAPPSWDVSAAGTYAQIHGASWLISFSPPVRARAGPMAPTQAADAIDSK